jgi:hypothetical protein
MRQSKKYFISFVEEAVMNPDWAGYVGGRIEVSDVGSDTGYAAEEIRFFTKNRLSEFYRLRDEYDFKEINAAQLDRLRKEVAKNFYKEAK